jgi:hypothetical protein
LILRLGGRPNIRLVFYIQTIAGYPPVDKLKMQKQGLLDAPTTPIR